MTTSEQLFAFYEGMTAPIPRKLLRLTTAGVVCILSRVVIFGGLPLLEDDVSRLSGSASVRTKQMCYYTSLRAKP